MRLCAAGGMHGHLRQQHCRLAREDSARSEKNGEIFEKRVSSNLILLICLGKAIDGHRLILLVGCNYKSVTRLEISVNLHLYAEERRQIISWQCEKTICIIPYCVLLISRIFLAFPKVHLSRWWCGGVAYRLAAVMIAS